MGDDDFDDIVEEWEGFNFVKEEKKVEKSEEEKENKKREFDIDFDNLPQAYVPFVRCHCKQREYLERLALRQKWHYRDLVKFCSKVTGREIRDTGELSYGEAEKVIGELGK